MDLLTAPARKNLMRRLAQPMMMLTKSFCVTAEIERMQEQYESQQKEGNSRARLGQPAAWRDGKNPALQ